MYPRYKGFSLIDVVVGIALILILFLSLFGILKASLMVSSLVRAKTGASAVAATHMEYLRGISYNSLGTVGGIPSGSVPQYATTTENGISYVTHTFINYVDDQADGTGASDTNGITTDYKRASITVSYTLRNQQKSVDLVSNFAPPGIETASNGGTLVVKAVTATGAPVINASVAITNTSLSPQVNIATFTNTDGLVSLPGAATSSSYQIAVSKNGYSSAQTYARDTTNQNPNPGFLTVSLNQTTTGTFPVDLLSTFSLATFSPIATSTFSDTFADSSKLANMSSTTVSGGVLTLIDGETQGSALSLATTSDYLVSWGALMATTTIPVGATAILRIYDASGVLIPDSALAGNSSGFMEFPIQLSTISTSTYPSLSVGATLSKTEDAPSVTGWSLSYTSGPIPIPNVSFSLTGAKTIGSTGGGSPIYKTNVDSATNSNGIAALTLEWDQYLPAVSSYDIQDACPSPPFVLAPGASLSASLILGATTADSLRVSVTNNAGAPVSSATVTLSRTNYEKTVMSSSCGGAYFGEIANANDYTLVISKSGYTTTTFTNVPVSGASIYGATFP